MNRSCFLPLALSLLWLNSQPAFAEAGEILAGTAFFYNTDGDMFTNRHVVEKCQPGTIRVRTYDKAWRNARVLAIDARVDVAAISIDHPVTEFASFRLHAGTSSIFAPLETEDAFSAGFSDPWKNDFKIQYKWGQVQPWNDPNEIPYVNRMRMDAFPGSSGSPILDYAGLLIGILFAGSTELVQDLTKLRAAGYGDKWIYVHNDNALIMFANDNHLKYNAWDKWKRQDPKFIWQHAERISALVVCKL